MIKTLLACALVPMPFTSVGLATKHINTTHNLQIRPNRVVSATTDTAQDILDKINKLPKNSVIIPFINYKDASLDKDAINNNVIKVSNGTITTDDVKYITQYTGTLKSATVNPDTSITLNFVSINFDIEKDGKKVSGTLNVAIQASDSSRVSDIKNKIKVTDFYLPQANNSTDASKDKKWMDQGLQELNSSLTDSDLLYISYSGTLTLDHKSQVVAHIIIGEFSTYVNLNIHLSSMPPNNVILDLITKTDISLTFDIPNSTTDPATITALRLALQKANYGYIPTPYLRFLYFSNVTLERDKVVKVDVNVRVEDQTSALKTLNVTYQNTPAQAVLARIKNVNVSIVGYHGLDAVSTDDDIMKLNIIKTLQNNNPDLTSDDIKTLSLQIIALHRYESTNVLLTSTCMSNNVKYTAQIILKITLESDTQAISNKMQDRNIVLAQGSNPTFDKEKAIILNDLKKANPSLNDNDMACLKLVAPTGNVLKIGTWNRVTITITAKNGQIQIYILVSIPFSNHYRR